MTKPFFSVVIPTKGRTHVVDWAIRTTLAQTFQDLECVVIDNNFDDRVEKICEQFNDPRLRRIKTGGLNMPDNLDEAYVQARGKYAVMIEDRQCIYLHALSYVHELCRREDLQCLVWNNDIFEDALRPARVRRYDGDRSLRRVRSDDVLEGYCGRRPGQDPMQFVAAHRCAVRTDLLARIRAQTGLKMCEAVSPDITAGLKIMNELESYHYFNGALSVSHSFQMSNGLKFHKDKSAADDFWQSIGGREQAYAYVKVKACFNENTAFNDYTRLATVLGGRLADHPLDPVYYYTTLGVSIEKAREEGFDRREELAAWRKALAAEPASVRVPVEENLKNRNRRRLLQKLRVGLGIRAVERMVKKKKGPRTRYVETAATVQEFVETESKALADRDLAVAS